MLTGEAKKQYQREYMRVYMRDVRLLAKNNTQDGLQSTNSLRSDVKTPQLRPVKTSDNQLRPNLDADGNIIPEAY